MLARSALFNTSGAFPSRGSRRSSSAAFVTSLFDSTRASDLINVFFSSLLFFFFLALLAARS